MAGDWIKLEHATLRKPEVAQVAQDLGVSRHEALGLLVDYFAWLDQNLPADCNGRVTLMSRASIDLVMQRPGFAASLEHVGWASWPADDILVITNYHHHLSRTAKARALAQKRQSRSRHAKNVTGALPEKRRGSVSTETVADAQGRAGPGAQPRSHAREARPVLDTKWWTSNQGIEKAARTVGLAATPGETHYVLKQRVFAKLKETKR